MTTDLPTYFFRSFAVKVHWSDRVVSVRRIHHTDSLTPMHAEHVEIVVIWCFGYLQHHVGKC